MKNILPFLLVIIIAGGAGFGFQRYLQNEKRDLAPIIPKAVNSDVIGTQRPTFSLEDLEGKTRNIDEWNGKVVLVNFWATWCPPCKKEMPAFIELHEKYQSQGFEVIGIALDDEDSVQDFVDTLGVNYTVVAAEHAGLELSRLYGNRIGALPFSVFVGRDGKIELTQAGELSKEHVEEIIKPMLAL
ncbi:MAG: TlpA family protein disulfide reductase [endosymbiont of Galathealinum brachiosum]|uniref:TlpA family protein disulfide reductase n=1 Tax=endosymbiont of Galathealinum brachiosum TaxID=2200906 RepID=A0A370D9K4_9GAMM|nr:MAG: TlpA family protein disulfide reductase [endosymbiont of Galathealinum brachiosum]